jgi:hypothetical protein
MNRLPSAEDLTSPQFKSLELVAAGFTSRRAIPPDHLARLVELGLIQSAMGGLVITPAGRMVTRIQIGGGAHRF